MTDQAFKDHFSGHAAAYAAFRPEYPASLFVWLAEQSPARELAWDCATGNGQAARELAKHFARVIATDASAAQIREGVGPANVEFRAEPAETSSLASASIDLAAVAQAYHWLDHSAYQKEVRRVKRPGGVLAVWAYQLASVSPAVDAVVLRLYEDPLGPYWPPERRSVESGYRHLGFQWPELEAPPFHMEMRWGFEAFTGYLRTWSASSRHLAATGIDAVAVAGAELRAAWGAAGERAVRWPLILRVFRVGAAAGQSSSGNSA